MKNIESQQKTFHWSRTSYVLLSGFLTVIFLIGYVWWPLLEEYINLFDPEISLWRQIDYLLIGNFLVMSILIMLNADLKRDIPFALVALVGGYVIEAWGTLSGLWTYYTLETPPLWIIPAWPIAALSVNRLSLFARQLTRRVPSAWFRWAYWLIFGGFYILLLEFALPTRSHFLTIFALVFCAVIILTEKDQRSALLILLMGSALGYFLERWGTTRLCWAYYTGGTPPFITVLSHGMASVAVWRVFNTLIGLLNNSPIPLLNSLIPQERHE